ncbi:MAG: hypothetical protein Q9213_002071 [Squamulea squamosa]
MAATDCFTQVGDRYTKPSILTHRVEGIIEEVATLNITTPSQDDIFEAMKATDRPFNRTLRGWAPKLTYPVEPGRTGYYGFTVTLGCFAGTLADCIGGEVQPGTSIEACTPMTLASGTTDGTPTLDGTGAFVQSDDISHMTTNPSATAMPATEETLKSVASLGALGSGMLIFMAIINILWCAF